jgi:hypothetical protein
MSLMEIGGLRGSGLPSKVGHNGSDGCINGESDGVGGGGGCGKPECNVGGAPERVLRKKVRGFHQSVEFAVDECSDGEKHVKCVADGVAKWGFAAFEGEQVTANIAT